MDVIRPGTMLLVIFCAAGVFTGSGHASDSDQYRQLNLVNQSRALSEKERDAVTTLETIPGYLKEFVAADLNGDGRDEIIVLAKEVDSALLSHIPPVSGIIRLESGHIRYLYRFPPDYINADPLVADLNADGVVDLVYTAWGGGNGFNSSPQVVVWWDGTAFRHQNIGEWRNIYDLDGDGALEFETCVDPEVVSYCALGCDTSMLAMRNIMYAASMVWGWRDGLLCDITKEVPAFFRDVRLPALESQRLEMEEIKQEYSGDEFADVMECLLNCLEIAEARAARLAEIIKD
jgi:hypothetical protein